MKLPRRRRRKELAPYAQVRVGRQVVGGCGDEQS